MEKKRENPIKAKGKQKEYFKTDKLTWKAIKENIPSELYPTERYKFIFESVLVLMAIVLVLQVPWTQIFSMNTDLEIVLGFPWTLFRFKPFDLVTDSMPIIWGGLIMDLLVYILAAYIIDFLMSLFLKYVYSGPLLLKKRKKEIPEEYKLKTSKFKNP